VKPARDPAARTAANVAMTWMTSGLERVKATETLVEGSCKIGGRGVNLPPLPHPATAPPRYASSELFWGGKDTASGEGGVGGVGASPPAVVVVAEAAVSVEFSSVQAPTVVAAHLRRRRRRQRRRRLAPVVAVAEDAGRLHVTVMVCIPVTWPKTTPAFRPLAIHRSYTAEKSAMETAGCVV
jgi:hypothetical protein